MGPWVPGISELDSALLVLLYDYYNCYNYDFENYNSKEGWPGCLSIVGSSGFV